MCIAWQAACDWSRLGEYICHLTYGPIVTGSRPQHVEAGVPVVRQGDIAETGLYERTPRGLGPESPRCILGERAGQCVLFCRSDSVGGAQSVLRLVFLKTRLGREQIAAYANGVGTPNISFGEMRALQIAALPSAYQDALERCYRELHCHRESAKFRAEAERLPRHRRRSMKTIYRQVPRSFVPA